MARNKFFISTLLLFFALYTYAQDDSDKSGKEVDVFATSTEINKIELYPNPAVDYLIVEVRNSELKNAQFELRSMIGNKLIIRPESIGSNKYRISLKEFASGYYFLIIRDDLTRYKKAFKFLKN